MQNVLVGTDAECIAEVNGGLTTGRKPADNEKMKENRIMKSVYVGNLPYATTDNELKALFEPFGTVHSARIKTDRDTGRPLGYGFVTMDDADAAKAIQELDGKEMAGRNLRVNESREKSSSDRPPRRDGRSFGDRPPRREFNDRDNRPYGDRPPRREFGDRDNRPYGDRPPRREFSDRDSRPYGDRPPRREFGDRDNRGFGGFTPHNPPAEDYDAEQDDDASDYRSSSREDFRDDRPRRRTFRKNNDRHFQRDFRDDRPRRPFFKNGPRKKGYRPNEDYDSED